MKTKKLFEKYGQKVTYAVNGEETEEYDYKAFIQPLRYKNKLYLRGKYTPVGKNKEDYYLYIGPAEFDVSKVDAINYHLFIDDAEYLVYRAEKHFLSDSNVYFWAIIRPVITDDNSDSDIGDVEAVG